METACTCSDFGRDGPQSSNIPTTNLTEKRWTNADLCNQCTSIDLNKLLHSESSYNCEAWPKFRSRPDSTCPLCQFFVAVVSTTGSTINFNEEFEYRLGLTSPAVMFSSTLADALNTSALDAIRFIGVKTSDSRYPHQPDLCIAPLVNIDENKLPLASIRRLWSDQINFNVLKSWIVHCKTHHRDTCTPLRWFQENRVSGEDVDIRVIDCERMQVTKASLGCSYIALSYVWGLPIEGQSSAGLKLDNALSEELPATIKDAIQVVLRLGYRYLWVDKYCIDQFDEDDKRKQIAMMDMVYNGADVTIIAAAGTDPSFGLPGMGYRARSEQPHIELNGQVWVSNRGDVEAVIKKSKWFKRAWTYQEALFSRRRLIFTPDQVYYECNNNCLREDLDFDLHQLRDERTLPCNGTFSGGFGSFRDGLDQHLIKYTKRELSWPDDAINGMRGIFRAFGSTPSPIRHLWGIPVDRHAYSLYGYEVLEARNELNSKPDCLISSFTMGLLWKLERPSKRREQFPSWSWAGWTEQLADHAWGVNEHLDNDTDVKVMLKRVDGSLESLSEDLVVLLNDGGFHPTAWTSTLQIEADVIQLKFKYFKRGLEGVRFVNFSNRPPPKYVVVVELLNKPESIFWPLELTPIVSTDQILHTELCESVFDCLIFQRRFGLVVRAAGSQMERIGKISVYGSCGQPRLQSMRKPQRSTGGRAGFNPILYRSESQMQQESRETGATPQPLDLREYFSCTRRTIALG